MASRIFRQFPDIQVVWNAANLSALLVSRMIPVTLGTEIVALSQQDPYRVNVDFQAANDASNT
jgi:hypothetical protein